MKESSITISSNTLFHFTKNIENVLSILTEGFKPHFCLEDMNIIADESEFYDELEYAIPMVCYCDIPLSFVKNHMSKYGRYGIGLSKDWGMKNNISPILYVYKKSAISSALMEIVITSYASGMLIGNDIMSEEDSASEENSDSEPNYYCEINKWNTEELLNIISRIRCFMKPYEGKLWRDGKYIEKIRFYDEREWRYVPKLPNLTGMSKKEYLDISLRNVANRMLSEQGILSFKPSDIKYIIVSNEDEIIRIIKEIRHIGDKYSEDDFLLLSSKVISAEHIIDDF